MPALSSISTVGDKLIVGQVDTSFLTASSRVFPGTAVLNGPVFIGATPQIGIARATCMIGPPLPGVTAPASLEVTGITNIIGSLNVFAVSLFTGVTTKNALVIKNALSLKNGVDLKNSVSIGNGAKINNAPAVVHGTLVVNGVVNGSIFNGSVFNGYATGNKPLGAFDIPHWKDKNKRIRHLCAEGPEAGIYIRGKLKNSNVIKLPEYWDGIVDPESITVSLTQIGTSQDLIVDKIEWGKIIKIKSGNASAINCFYEVWASRWINPNDHNEKLHVVYEGDSPDDYPGNNESFLIGGWDYDKRIPKWKE